MCSCLASLLEQGGNCEKNIQPQEQGDEAGMVHPMHNYKNYKQPMNSPFFHIFADETVVSVHNITTKNSVLIEQHIANCLSKAENSLNMCELRGPCSLRVHYVIHIAHI